MLRAGVGALEQLGRLQAQRPGQLAQRGQPRLDQAVRQTVEAVREAEVDVSQAALARRLGLTRSTISWRVNRALEGGWWLTMRSRALETAV
jgi:hypothetical protein